MILTGNLALEFGFAYLVIGFLFAWLLFRFVFSERISNEPEGFILIAVIWPMSVLVFISGVVSDWWTAR